MFNLIRSTTRNYGRSALFSSSKVAKKNPISSVFTTTAVRTLKTEQAKVDKEQLSANKTRSIFSMAPLQPLSRLFQKKQPTVIQTRAVQTATAPAAPTTTFFNRPLSFWRNWLLASSVGLGVVGLDMMLLHNVLEPYVWNKMFFSGSDLPSTFTPETKNYIRFLYGVMGAVTTGWATMMYHYVKTSFESRDIRVWNGIAWSMGTWWVLDSVLSVELGFGMNALLNTDLALLFAVPLYASRKYFKKLDAPKPL